MKYSSINDLDLKIENIIHRVVKHYYTDWKHYDRPKYMKCKGSSDKEDKDLILIARKCGTYLVKTSDIIAGNDWATAIYDYYRSQEQAIYYHINIDQLECRLIDPAKYLKEIKTA